MRLSFFFFSPPFGHEQKRNKEDARDVAIVARAQHRMNRMTLNGNGESYTDGEIDS